MAKKKPQGWGTRTTTAWRIAEIIRSDLDDLDEMNIRDLRRVTKRIAEAFDFTDEERKTFVAWALMNHANDTP